MVLHEEACNEGINRSTCPGQLGLQTHPLYINYLTSITSINSLEAVATAPTVIMVQFKVRTESPRHSDIMGLN